jgi:hypothetical protein
MIVLLTLTWKERIYWQIKKGTTLNYTELSRDSLSKYKYLSDAKKKSLAESKNIIGFAKNINSIHEKK